MQIAVYTCYVTWTVGWHGTLIIYVYYIITAFINKKLMSPIVALTYNQVCNDVALSKHDAHFWHMHDNQYFKTHEPDRRV